MTCNLTNRSTAASTLGVLYFAVCQELGMHQVNCELFSRIGRSDGIGVSPKKWLSGVKEMRRTHRETRVHDNEGDDGLWSAFITKAWKTMTWERESHTRDGRTRSWGSWGTRTSGQTRRSPFSDVSLRAFSGDPFDRISYHTQNRKRVAGQCVSSCVESTPRSW